MMNRLRIWTAFECEFSSHQRLSTWSHKLFMFLQPTCRLCTGLLYPSTRFSTNNGSSHSIIFIDIVFFVVVLLCWTGLKLRFLFTSCISTRCCTWSQKSLLNQPNMLEYRLCIRIDCCLYFYFLNIHFVTLWKCNVVFFSSFDSFFFLVAVVLKPIIVIKFIVMKTPLFLLRIEWVAVEEREPNKRCTMRNRCSISTQCIKNISLVRLFLFQF